LRRCGIQVNAGGKKFLAAEADCSGRLSGIAGLARIHLGQIGLLVGLKGTDDHPISVEESDLARSDLTDFAGYRFGNFVSDAENSELAGIFGRAEINGAKKNFVEMPGALPPETRLLGPERVFQEFLRSVFCDARCGGLQGLNFALRVSEKEDVARGEAPNFAGSVLNGRRIARGHQCLEAG
jgi:hypothetical protein